eukprot:scaffold251031_cov38-Prasinocladus_malaysianus.AAC.1
MSVSALERAQEASALDDFDSDFMDELLATNADYEDEELIDTEPGVRASHRAMVQVVQRRPGGGLTSQRPKFPARSHALQAGISRHSGFILRKRRYQRSTDGTQMPNTQRRIW